MHKFYRHFQIFIFLLRISLLGVFLFTSTLSFAFNCWDHDGTSLNQNSQHTHESTLKNESHHATNEHDEGCHTSEKIQKNTSVQLKNQSKISPIFHCSLLDTYNTYKINNGFWIEKKISLPRDPPRYSHAHLVWIVILNC